MRNALYYGDNLVILKKHVAEESVDLIYLDPPFNSNRDYNVLFREQSGESAQAQIKAFTDTWKWNELAYTEFCESCPRPQLVDLLQGFVTTLGRNDVTAYLVMMAPRLVELHRVLKPTGSLYLHCDPTVSHYLKLILDVLFGAKNFRNEIIWKRTSAHNDAAQGLSRFGRNHDLIFFYAKNNAVTWNVQFASYDEDYVRENYRYIEEGTGRRYKTSDLTAAKPGGDTSYEWKGMRPSEGRFWAYSRANMERFEAEGRIVYTRNGIPRLKHYLDEMPGVAIQDTWIDIPPIGAQAKERLGYPTQKPLALLERILNASSNPGDVVLDPFCGCGTAVIAAQKLSRQWIGIDITHLAIALIKYRLADTFNLKDKRDYDVIGEPTTDAEAHALALQDRDEFQKWVVGLAPRARPYQEKKGADRGIDGVVFFRDDTRDPKKCVVQVKSGHVSVRDIRDFAHVIEREKATLGLFITLEPPTAPMQQEADALGFYTTPLGNRKIPRLQIRTIAQLLSGEGFLIPMAALLIGVKQAEAVQEDAGQEEMEF